MNQFAALLAAEHLQDLLREAAAERRARPVRGSTPSVAVRALRRALDSLGSILPAIVRPATGPTPPAVGRAEA